MNEELITETEEDYEDLIMKLAEQPRKLKVLKNKLASNILKEPLFDTKRYTRNFEAGIKLIEEPLWAKNLTILMLEKLRNIVSSLILMKRHTSMHL